MNINRPHQRRLTLSTKLVFFEVEGGGRPGRRRVLLWVMKAAGWRKDRRGRNGEQCHALRGVLGLLGLLLVAAPAWGQAVIRQRFFALVRAGDSVYAQKAGLRTLNQSLTYYDRAQAIAQRSADTLLLAEAVFAKGRVYDAWNQQPLKTVATFQQAASLFRRLPDQYVRYLYVRQLVAHAYDKIPDSARTVAVLRGLYHELRTRPDTLLRRVPFTVEMALSATEVRAYPLADSILRHLTRRAWIRNDPATYDYLTHYYLVRSRLDLLGPAKALGTPYLDSLRLAYDRAQNSFDRFYYIRNLAQLTYAAGQYRAAADNLRVVIDMIDHNTSAADDARLRQALIESEARASQRQREYEETARRLIVGVLSGALVVISLLTFRLYRQRQASRGQAQALAVVNHQLDDKVAQVELLNKEIQHRVKNNLHMIFSLLQMQERRSDNEEVIENLQAARLRVESIAALHNQLLVNPEGLDLGRYLTELISAVVSCLANDRQVITHLRTEALHLPVNAYFAVSLILNEWVTNSIKYADADNGVLEINVSMCTRAHEVCIQYADSGPAIGSLPTLPGRGRTATLASSGLGTQIIKLLTRQLGATLRTLDDHPYHYELCIPTGE